MVIESMNKSEKFWDKRAVEYDKDEKKWSDSHNKVVEHTKKHLKTDDIIIDYGCGSGILTFQFADLVKEIHALDISSKNIEAAKQRAKGNKIENIVYTQTTIFDEEYKKESYDCVLAFNVLHLLENIPETLSRINELLKSGGLFISETTCLGEQKSFFRSIISFFSKIGLLPYVEKLSFSELEKMISSSDFQILETDVIGETMPTYFVVAKKI